MLLWILAIGVWDFPLHAAKLAATAPTSTPQLTQPAEPPPSELPKIVEQFAAQPMLSAEDCAKLARETLTHGQMQRQSGQPVKPGIVQDGLAAVDQGERTEPKAANWPELRTQLQDLLNPPPQQDQKQDEKKNEEQQKQQQKQEQQSQDQKNEHSQDQQKQEQQQQDQQKSEQQKQQEQAEQQRQQDEKQQQSQQQQPAQSEPPKEEQTQKIGGEKPKDAELRDHPELAVPLQKLDQVRDQDSPAELFDRLNNAEPRSSDQPKKDW